jgi:HemX protein
MTLLTNLVLYIYALSLLFSLSDLLQRNRNARWIGAGLLGLVWVLQASFFFNRLWTDNVTPVVTQYETIYFFSWVIVTIALVLFAIVRTEVFLGALSVIGFVVLLSSLTGTSAVNTQLSELTANGGIWPLHIALSIGAYALFAISALFALGYLYLHARLKAKKLSGFILRLPNLQWMNQMTYRFALVGWAALSVALLLGCGWLIVSGHVAMLNDLKVYASLVVYIAYGMYLWQGVRLAAVATKLAKWNLIVFVLVMLNYSAMNFLSEFHKWSWMS